MNKRNILSIAFGLLTMFVFFSAGAGTSFGQIWQGPIFLRETGMIKLGQDQTLRLTIVNDDDKNIRVGFRRIDYTLTNCNMDICKYSTGSQWQSDPIQLAPGEAVSLSLLGTTFGGDFRAQVLSSNEKIKANALIIDTTTGETNIIMDIMGY